MRNGHATPRLQKNLGHFVWQEFMLIQIMSNLLDSSLKFHPGKKVIISVLNLILQIQRLHVLCLDISLVHIDNSMRANVAALQAKHMFSDVLCTRHVKTFNECISFEFCTDNKYSTFAILEAQLYFCSHASNNVRNVLTCKTISSSPCKLILENCQGCFGHNS